MQKNVFIIILRYTAPLEKIDAFRAAHLEFLDDGYAKNLFIASGPQVPRNGGVILAKCATKDALQTVLASDPFALHHLATYEIIEFTPTKYNIAEATGLI